MDVSVTYYAGIRVVGHKWNHQDVVTDLATVNEPTGVLQPDHGVDFYSQLSLDDLFSTVKNYWNGVVGIYSKMNLPDPTWKEAIIAGTSHLAMNINQQAPDVAVVNYNVFNRDGMYIGTALQRAGQLVLSAEIVDYFVNAPFK